jgi:hypothetical protein
MNGAPSTHPVWVRYRGWRRTGIGALLAFLVLAAAALAAGHAGRGRLAVIAVTVAVLALGLALHAASLEAGLRCPRCRRAFFRRRAWLQPSFPAARCAHCGLGVGEAP